MNIKKIDEKDIDEKYYQWKDVFAHSVLKPTFSIKDSQHSLTVYEALSRKNLPTELLKNDFMLQKIDKNFNGFFEQELAFMVQFTKEEYIQNIVNEGFSRDQIFIIFKDDILKCKPLTTFINFLNINYKEFIQQNLN